MSYVCIFALLAFAGGSLPLSILLSFWAVSTAVSRALMGRHYLGDVCVGLLLGFVTMALVSKVHSRLPGPLSLSTHHRSIQRCRHMKQASKCLARCPCSLLSSRVIASLMQFTFSTTGWINVEQSEGYHQQFQEAVKALRQTVFTAVQT